MTTQQAFALGLQHHHAGRLAEAEALYRQILAVQPHHPEALHRLGILAHQAGRDDLAAEWIRQALAITPTDPAMHSNLGEVYRATGRLDDAIASYGRALQLVPDLAEIHNNLGLALAGKGRLDEAVAAYRRALQLKPGYVDTHVNLGNALSEQDDFTGAMASFREALRLRPDYAVAHGNAGAVLAERGQLDEAVVALGRALQLQPNYADAHNNLGNTLKDQGRLDEAMASFRRAIQLRPEHAGMQSNLVHTRHYHPGQDDAAISAGWRDWNRQFEEPRKRWLRPHANDRDPKRRLRIGYVSADFRGHVVGRNLIPLFKHHDSRYFEIRCYAGVMKPDHVTEEFRRRAGSWRDIMGMPDELLAETLRQDGVDILVDLAQHTAGNRLPLFAYQPAPVQVSFAGYPESTGLEAIGYRISDRYLEEGCSLPSSPPRPSTPPGSVEQVLFLDSFWCYDPCGAEVTVNELPAEESGIVTFGSLNNFCKINEPVLKLWARVLGGVKDSRLILLSRVGSHRARTLESLQRGGIEGHRVEFVEPRPREAYLELYHRLDIVLDPFPYNGHTTSLDALWMGLPVVSLAGTRPVSRGGLSQLSNLGLQELVGFSEDDYVRIAAQLAHDLPRLAELRRTLRPRMEASTLMDAPRFTGNIEAAYRTIWQQWCAQKHP